MSAIIRGRARIQAGGLRTAGVFFVLIVSNLHASPTDCDTSTIAPNKPSHQEVQLDDWKSASRKPVERISTFDSSPAFSTPLVVSAAPVLSSSNEHPRALPVGQSLPLAVLDLVSDPPSTPAPSSLTLLAIGLASLTLAHKLRLTPR